MSEGPSTRTRKDGDPVAATSSSRAVGLYAVVFLLMNAERQDVSFVFFTVRTRLIWLILLSMALGALLATFVPPLAVAAKAAGDRRRPTEVEHGSATARPQDPNALGDPLGRLVGEREARRARPPARPGRSRSRART